MKKKFLFILLLLCFTKVFAQNPSDSTHSKTKGIIKIYPLQALVGEIRLGFEKPISKRLSLEISPGFNFFLHNAELDGDIYNLDARGGTIGGTGFSIRGSLRYYFSQKKSQGLFISPLFLFKYFYSKEVLSNNLPFTSNIQIFCSQFIIGYKFEKKQFSIEPYSGLGFINVIEKYDYHDPKLYNSFGTYRTNYPTIILGVAFCYRLYSKK